MLSETVLETCIMEDISFSWAQKFIEERLYPLPPETRPLHQAEGFVLARPIYALFDVPTKDVSLKDGFAVRSQDVAHASPEHPVTLRLVGQCYAGQNLTLSLRPGEAIRLTSGAVIPQGADAVLAEEFVRLKHGTLLALADASPGRNILFRGADIRRGNLLLEAGTCLHPPDLGLLASAGHAEVPVYPRPKVLVVAIGDEIVPVGKPLQEGKVFASNLLTIYSWLRYFGFEVETKVVPDQKEALVAMIQEFEGRFDALVTSGGAWKGERDLIVRTLDSLGWEKVFHRLRLGPGKALAFGLLKGRPVFCLPGGPPSNQAAFLLLALPGLLRLSGKKTAFPKVRALLLEEVSGTPSWTQVFFGLLEKRGETLVFHPQKPKSRLEYLAEATGWLLLPEGESRLPAGSLVSISVLKPEALC